MKKKHTDKDVVEYLDNFRKHSNIDIKFPIPKPLISKQENTQKSFDHKKEPVFTIGNWYKCQTFNSDFFIMNYNPGNKHYGFSYTGKWIHDSYNVWLTKHPERCKPATDKEVEEALIKEAKRRGFKLGVKFIGVRDVMAEEVEYSCPYDKDDGEAGSSFQYVKGTLYTYGLGRHIVFENGIWAEIVVEKEESFDLTKEGLQELYKESLQQIMTQGIENKKLIHENKELKKQLKKS